MRVPRGRAISIREKRTMRRTLPFNVVLTCLLFAACVTINVYFPAAAAEKAADQIIDSVTGASGAAPAKEPQKSPSGSLAAPQNQPLLLAAVGRVLELIVPAAQAQGAANLDIETPQIRAITGSMRARFAQLEKYFDAGAVGLTADGLVEVRDPAVIALAERAQVASLVAQDNRDRSTLYAEIAKANGHPEWEADIRRTFARRWVERGAKPGWFYQDGGAWKRK
jgi:uncharacterized protein